MSFVLGACAGAAVALLMAPATGDEMRRKLAERAREGAEKEAEAARQGQGVRKAITRGVEGFAERLAPVMPERGDQSADDAALAAVATLVGGLILARAVDDANLSDRILAASRAALSPKAD